MCLYKRIRSRREELGLSQEELAHRIGYKDRSSIAKIESGVNDITQSKIKAIADVLDTTPSYLMGWDESPAVLDNHPSSPSLPIQRITQALPQLNDEGQAKLADYADDLVSSGRYLPGPDSK